MPDRRIEKLKELIGEGEKFSYDNFSVKGARGYPSSLRTPYVAWKTKAENILSTLFGKSSSMYETFKKGDEVVVIGNGEDKFESAQGLILGALNAAIDTLEFTPTPEIRMTPPPKATNSVFVVHGHDEKLKTQLEVLLAELKLEPVVLHRKADEGLTIIEKFEKHSDVGYAFILLTPDDISYSASEESQPDNARNKEYRARPNVIFEFGYFVGKLGRGRVCCLYKRGVALPTDVLGMIYKEVKESVEEVAFAIIKDLKAAGYQVGI